MYVPRGLAGNVSILLKATLREEAPGLSFLTSPTVSELGLCLSPSTQIQIFPSKGCSLGCVCLWPVPTGDICQVKEEEKGNIETEKVTENKQRQE